MEKIIRRIVVPGIGIVALGICKGIEPSLLVVLSLLVIVGFTWLGRFLNKLYRPKFLESIMSGGRRNWLVEIPLLLISWLPLVLAIVAIVFFFQNYGWLVGGAVILTYFLFMAGFTEVPKQESVDDLENRVREEIIFDPAIRHHPWYLKWAIAIGELSPARTFDNDRVFFLRDITEYLISEIKKSSDPEEKFRHLLSNSRSFGSGIDSSDWVEKIRQEFGIDLGAFIAQKFADIYLIRTGRRWEESYDNLPIQWK